MSSEGAAVAKEAKASLAGPDSESAKDPAGELARMVNDLAAGDGAPVFAKLPKQYRDDLERFLAESVRPVDAAERREIADAVSRLAEALGRKGGYVIASERFEMTGPGAAAARRHFGALCRVVSATAKWPGWSDVTAGDAESLVKAVVAAIAAEPAIAGELRGLRFETASRDGGRAVVRVTSAGQRGELAVVAVDDVWVPEVVVTRWGELFAKGSGGERADFRGFATRIAEVVPLLDAVSTQAEFDELAGKVGDLLLAEAAAAEQKPRPVKPDEYVTVEVLGPMDDARKDRVVWELASLTDAPASGVADATDRKGGDGIVVSVGPVSDLAAFAGRLKGLRVERIDAEKKTVTARVAGP